MNESTGPSPRIYVASLSDYNAGRLHGVWIDAAEELDEIWSQINAMLAASPEPGAEEFAIHDHDGFYLVNVHEYESIENVHLLAEGIARHGKPFAVWAALLDTAEWNTELNAFEDRFEGAYDSYADFGEQLLDNFDIDVDELDLPEWVRDYIHIDTDALGRTWDGPVRCLWYDGRLYVFFA